MNQTIVPRRPAKRYLLLHDSRRGLEPKVFECRSDLGSMLGVVVYEDLTDAHHDLLRFLGVIAEFGDYVILKLLPDTEGEWSKPNAV